MRKVITGETTDAVPAVVELHWIDVEAVAVVEVSSEATGFPVENALVPTSSGGWRAGLSAAARIYLRFDSPQTISKMQLAFVEGKYERSQEWAITASFAGGQSREILRQGWNFSPSSGSKQSREQNEVYIVNLRDVVSLELWIDADRGQDRYPASVEKWLLSA